MLARWTWRSHAEAFLDVYKHFNDTCGSGAHARHAAQAPLGRSLQFRLQALQPFPHSGRRCPARGRCVFKLCLSTQRVRGPRLAILNHVAWLCLRHVRTGPIATRLACKVGGWLCSSFFCLHLTRASDLALCRSLALAGWLPSRCALHAFALDLCSDLAPSRRVAVRNSVLFSLAL